MTRPSIRTFAFALVILATVGACARSGQPDASLRVYDVPPARTEALGMALNDVFRTAEDRPSVGKASSRIPGQLLVLAPESMHASIDETLDHLAADTGATKGAGNVQLSFWLLDAIATPTGDATDAPQPVLAALAHQFPGQAFRVFDQGRLAISRRHANAHMQTPRNTAVRVAMWEEGDGVLGDIEIVAQTIAGMQPLQTHIALPMDDYVVLAVTGAPDEDASSARRVYVVQATSD